MKYYFLIQISPVILPPVLFWIWIQRTDREQWNPEPYTQFFIAGALVGVPVALIEHFLSRWLGNNGGAVINSLRQGVLLAAVPEEVARAALLAWWIEKKRGFGQPKWIIAVAVALGMGQVSAENLLHYYAHSGLDRAGVWLTRTLFCVPTMGFYSLAIGVMTAWKRLHYDNWRNGMIAGVSIAIFGHALYDGTLLFLSTTPLGAFEAYAPIPVAALAITVCYWPVRRRYAEIIAAAA